MCSFQIELVVGSPSFTCAYGEPRKENGFKHEGALSSLPVKVEYDNSSYGTDGT